VLPSEIPPGIVGAGLTGRPQVRPPNEDLEQPIDVDEHGKPVYAQPPAEGNAIPGSCLRVLYTPLKEGHGGECPFDCPGRQSDGGCLADIVRYCNDHGIEWSFEVRIEDAGAGPMPMWIYTGPER